MDFDFFLVCMLFNICELIIISGLKFIFFYCDLFVCKINVLRIDYIISLLNFFVFYLRF